MKLNEFLSVCDGCEKIKISHYNGAEIFHGLKFFAPFIEGAEIYAIYTVNGEIVVEIKTP